MYFEVAIGLITTKFGDYTDDTQFIDYSEKVQEIILESNQLAGFKIKKDPVKDNICVYSINLVNINNEMVVWFKNKFVDYITIRVGNQDINDPVNKYNLFILDLKPIKCEYSFPELNMNSNIQIEAVSTVVYTLMKDKTLGAEVISQSNPEVTKKITSDNVTARVVSNSYATQLNAINNTTSTTGSTTKNKPSTRSDRNNNPGNLKYNGDTWVGADGVDNDVASDGGYFVKFSTPEAGARAMIINGANQVKKSGGSMTLTEYITKYAPPSGNNTKAYVDYVSKVTGISENQRITVEDIPKIVTAQKTHEGTNSGKFTDDVFQRGLDMAMNDRPDLFTSSVLDIIVAKGKDATQKLSDLKNQAMGIIESSGLYSFTGDKKGSELIEAFLGKISSAFGLVKYENGSSNMGASNFLYKDIHLPDLNTFELFRYIHKNFPPYYLDIPWILDDARFGVPTEEATTNDFLGLTAYTEINFLNRTSMNIQNLNTALRLADQVMDKDFILMDINYFYPEDAVRKFYGTNFIHKNLNNNTITVIKALRQMTDWNIPDTSSRTENGIFQKKTIQIKTLENETIENNYDGYEFDIRLKLILKHIKSLPRLFHCKVRSNDPNLIQFGRNYDIQINGLAESIAEFKNKAEASTTSNMNASNQNDISDGTNSTVASNSIRLTPYKINLEFVNKRDILELVYEVIFYEGSDIINI